MRCDIDHPRALDTLLFPGSRPKATNDAGNQRALGGVRPRGRSAAPVARCSGPCRLQRTISHHLLALLVPEPEAEGLQAPQERDRRDGLKERLRFVAFLQMIVGNPRAEMMDVMKTDISRKPLQHPGELVVRAAFERRLGVIPILPAFPVNDLELMLNIKQPNACRSGETHEGELEQQVSAESEDRAQADDHPQQQEMGPANAQSLAARGIRAS